MFHLCSSNWISSVYALACRLSPPTMPVSFTLSGMSIVGVERQMTEYHSSMFYYLVYACFSRCTTFKMLLSIVYALLFQYASLVGTVPAALQPPVLFNKDQLDLGLAENSSNAQRQVHVQVNSAPFVSRPPLLVMPAPFLFPHTTALFQCSRYLNYPFSVFLIPTSRSTLAFLTNKLKKPTSAAQYSGLSSK